jgi:uncharacterized protein YbbK (DUF523 family)/uncharacterized protein YbgA (DUF1722 family)
VQWVPVCPEVEIGLGTPRPRIDLTRTGTSLRLIQEGQDITSRMEAYTRTRLSESDLAATPIGSLCGYLFKSRSPSCGIGDVRVVERDGAQRNDGFGLFARAFRDRNPSVPTFDEGAFADPYAREAAVCAFFTMHRWHEHHQDGTLVEFHRAHRTLLIARDPVAVAELDRWLEASANAGDETPERKSKSRAHYERSLARIVQRVPDQTGHARALMAVVDEFDRLLPTGGRERREAHSVVQHLVNLYPDRADLAETISQLSALAAYHAPEIVASAYVNPHPRGLSLYRGL